MHKYLRAIGFSKLNTRKQLNDILTYSIQNATGRNYVSLNNETIFSEFSMNFSESIGIAVRGEFDEENRFLYEYYFPYLLSDYVSSVEDITVERHAEKESYAGVCDEMKVGVSLIFYLQNIIPYLKLKNSGRLPVKGTSLSLSALSTNAMILMPIQKNDEERRKSHKTQSDRLKKMHAARSGDEKAMESLTLHDMDIYSSISRKIRNEDLFSLVDTCFMPYGVECDMYNVVGEIIDFHKETNRITKEEIWVLEICCNELVFNVCINVLDLYGEPEIGRRFKGSIWLQGCINYPLS